MYSVLSVRLFYVSACNLCERNSIIKDSFVKEYYT